MAEQNGADPTGRSLLDQAAADDSITQARIRAVDPVPAVPEPGGATLEPALETGAEPPAAVRAVGVNRRLDPEVQAVDGRTAAPAPLAGARRRLSPRPVPVSRRRRPPATATATDEEPTPAEEMDDVGTHDEKAAKSADAEKAVTPAGAEAEETPATDSASSGRGTTATATKPAKPKTAAEIVAEQRAREKAAAEAPKDDTAATTPVARQPAVPSTGAVGNKTAAASAGKPGVVKAVVRKETTSTKGQAAMSAVGSGVARFRNLLASLIWLVAVIAAAVLALGALFTALDQANQSNEIVRFVLERGHDLVGPFKDLFRLETAKNTLLVNWGIAALVYLIAGKILERFIRP